ncbi:MAG: DUF885 domain-containing protein [Candidatus Aminicenantes bacterium]|nr:DUF885 domain-containing protein [Candidatus Aminicenantes bacterium]
MRKTGHLVFVLIFLFLISAFLPSQQNEEDQKFQKFLDSYFDDLWKFYPTFGTMQGYHKYDNKLEDMSSKNIEKMQETLDKYNQELVAKIDTTKLSPELQIDRAMMVDGLDRELIKHENLLPWEYNPLFYNTIISNCIRSLLTKEFAAADVRTKNAEERLKDLPKLIKQAKENLKTPPQLYTETAIAQFPAILEFYTSDLPKLIDETSSTNKAKLQAELSKAMPALTDYQNFLSSELLPRSTGNFRLAEAHRRLVRGTFQNMIPIEELLARAKADYNNIRREMFLVSIPFYRIMYPNINLEQLTTQRGEEEVKNIAIKGVFDKIKGDHVSRDEFIGRIEAVTAELKEFIQEKQLIDIPENNLAIEMMPPETRGLTWTSLVTPGIYESTEDYICRISPFDETWPEDKITSILEEYNNFFLPFYICRKVFPGQFVPQLYVNKHASLVRKMFPNMPMIKGWPVFVEEMIINSGYGNYDLRLRLNQLKYRLKTIMDFNLDFNIHEAGMTKEQAVAYMTRGGFQTEAEAERNWNRIILNPVDASYAYVGLQEFLDMDKDYKQLKGDAYNQREFLNKVLSHGAIPLRQLKQMMSQ